MEAGCTEGLKAGAWLRVTVVPKVQLGSGPGRVCTGARVACHPPRASGGRVTWTLEAFRGAAREAAHRNTTCTGLPSMVASGRPWEAAEMTKAGASPRDVRGRTTLGDPSPRACTALAARPMRTSPPAPRAPEARTQ